MSKKIVFFSSLVTIFSLVSMVGVFSVTTQSKEPKRLYPEPVCAPNQMSAVYFANRNFEGTPALIRCEDMVLDPVYLFNKDFTQDSSLLFLGDRFSAKFIANVGLIGGNYKVTGVANDSMKVYVNDDLLLDARREDRTETEDVSVIQGNYRVRLEYVNKEGPKAYARLAAVPV
jgi:hypothetical protein